MHFSFFLSSSCPFICCVVTHTCLSVCPLLGAFEAAGEGCRGTVQERDQGLAVLCHSPAVAFPFTTFQFSDFVFLFFVNLQH